MNKIDNYLERIQINEIALIAGISIASLLLTSFKMYKDYLTKAALQCSDLPSKEKAICMVRARMYAKNVQLQSLKGSTGKCVKVLNPKKCKLKLNAKIKKLATEVKTLAGRLKELKGQEYK